MEKLRYFSIHGVRRKVLSKRTRKYVVKKFDTRRECQFHSNQIILYVQEPLDLVFPLLQYTLSGASAASLCSSVSIVIYTKVLALEIALPKTSVTSESSTYVSASALPFITLVYHLFQKAECIITKYWVVYTRAKSYLAQVHPFSLSDLWSDKFHSLNCRYLKENTTWGPKLFEAEGQRWVISFHSNDDHEIENI